MFYSHDLLGRKSPLGAIWCVLIALTASRRSGGAREFAVSSDVESLASFVVELQRRSILGVLCRLCIWRISAVALC